MKLRIHIVIFAVITCIVSATFAAKEVVYLSNFAGVLRIADGTHVEMLCFEKNRISGKFSGREDAFNTSDRFHHYEFAIRDGLLTLKADGRQLFSAIQMHKVNDPASQLIGNDQSISGMNESSIILGSLSGSGQRISSWRKVELSGLSSMVRDFVLQLRYPLKPTAKFDINW